MATIRTAIELQDNFTSVLYQVINSVNLGLSAMEDLHQTMNSPVVNLGTSLETLDILDFNGIHKCVSRTLLSFLH